MTERNENKGRLECEDCGFVASSQEIMDQHFMLVHNMQLHNRETIFNCNLCPFITGDFYRYNIHHMIHVEKHGYLFEDENSAEKKQPSLSYNMDVPIKQEQDVELDAKMNEQNKNQVCLECEDCGFIDSNRAIMKQHMLDHNRKPTFKCDTCSFTTGKFDYYNMHKLFHISEDKNDGKERPGARYTCVDCSFSSEKRKVLAKHGRKRRHVVCLRSGIPDKKRSYLCPKCGFSLYTLSKVRMHLQGHEGETFYDCNVCGFESQTELDFEEHCRVYCKEKHYQCTMCNSSTYRTPKGLRYHYTTVHGCNGGFHHFD